jgi:alkylation response protein AidB-like acyl-CoA dehydrogenase
MQAFTEVDRFHRSQFLSSIYVRISKMNPMNLEPHPGDAATAQRVKQFIAQHVIPHEASTRDQPHGPSEETRSALVAAAAREGLCAPHVSKAWGGMGLDHRGKALVFEEAGYSPLGPVALNIAAPDEGNMHLLEQIGRIAQKERWLRPLAAGKIRSCFCMTEPDPGAGSDPSMLMTTATPHGDGFLIDGVKWFITGAVGASACIVMAKLPDGRATMFITDMASPGIRIERTMRALDTCFPGGHAVVRFDNLYVGAENILGELGEGFRYAQVRLSPARLTHCMRWLGAARRAHETAIAYAQRRQAFGQLLGRHEAVGFMLADNEIDLHAARLCIWHTAWRLDSGDLALHESSMTKVMASEAIWRVIDRSVQILGGQGVTDETIVARIFADARAFRIYDGPSEVHRWSIAKRIMRSTATPERGA